jgi:ABC-type nitrate/sulfonate/bicarbonate transport system ATPase subunit
MEAIYLADEIHVFSSRPARVARSFDVDLPSERSIFDDRVVAREVLAALGYATQGTG